MIRAKIYKNVSKFVKVCPEYCGLFFPDMVYVIIITKKQINSDYL